MVLDETSASVIVGVRPLVVALYGEHDRATVPELTALLDREMALDGADVVLDVRGVTFLDASTLGVILRARVALAGEGRSLALRSPSRFVRRILDVCELNALIEVPSMRAS